MLEIRHMRYFVAVAEELHFGRAAKRLHIVQPALSMQIKALEEDLGTQLFERNHHQVNLTAAGRFFYRQAQDILTRVEQASALVTRAALGEIGQIRIGISAGAAANAIPAALMKAFHKQTPQVQVELLDVHPAAQAKALLERQVDLVFGPSEAFVSVQKEVHGLYLDHFAFKLACSSEHPLASRQRVNVSKLAGETFVGIAAAEDRHGMLVTRFALPFTPLRSMQVHSQSALLSAVEANLAISVVSEALERNAPPNITFLPIDDVKSNMDLYLYTRASETDMSVQNFVTLANDMAPFRQ